MRNAAENTWKPSCAVYDDTLTELEEQSNSPQGLRLEHEYGCEDCIDMRRDTSVSNASTSLTSDGRNGYREMKTHEKGSGTTNFTWDQRSQERDTMKENLCFNSSHKRHNEASDNSLQGERQDVNVRPKLGEAKVVPDESCVETIINDGSDNDSYDDDRVKRLHREEGMESDTEALNDVNSDGLGPGIDYKQHEDTIKMSPNYTNHDIGIEYKDTTTTKLSHPDCVAENMRQYSPGQARVRESPTESSNSPWTFDDCNHQMSKANY